jgi:thiamine-phosphate pyrophosphorylase
MLEQLQQADADPADYIAYGPVFATSSKQSGSRSWFGWDSRKARAATMKPLVAIGGITRANARSVIDAGADSVAVIADLLSSPRKLRRNSCGCWCKLTRILRPSRTADPSARTTSPRSG